MRLEQFYPFPRTTLLEIIEALPANADLRWVQDEPRNMGAWGFLLERVVPWLGDRELAYIGRPWSASPASGSKGVHQAEATAIFDEAFGD